MKKRVLSALISVIMILSLAMSATASDTMTEIKAHLNHGINIELNGQPWQPEKTPITYDSSTYLPLRAVGEALGAQITWDGSTRTVSIVTDGAPPAEERAVRDAQETEQ